MANIKIFQLLLDVYDMLLGVTNSIVMQDRVAKLNDQDISAQWRRKGGALGARAPPNFQSDKKKCPFYKESALFSCLTLVCLSERYEIVPK